MFQKLTLTLVAGLGIVAVGESVEAQAPGDIYVVSQGTQAIVRVAPSSGAQAVVSSGGLLSANSPTGVTVAANGDLLVSHNGPEGGRILRVNPQTGAQSVVASGFTQASGLMTEASGDLLLTDLNTNDIRRVNATAGTSSVLSSVGQISGPLGIGREPGGGIVVTSRNNGRIVRIDPATGAQTVVSEGGLLGNPQWLAVNAAGDIFVTTGNAVVKVAAGTGAQSVLASGGPLFSPRGLAVDAGGDLVVANGNNRILRVNTGSGLVSEVSPNGGPESISGAAGLAIAPTPGPGGSGSDTTPPVLALPASITVLATGPSGAVVSYGVTATDDTDPAPVVLCSPPSGSTFPVGETAVGCTATDATGNQSAGAFTVSVTVTSASVTIKGTRLRANGASQLLFRVAGPTTSPNQNGDVTLTLLAGTYSIDAANSQPYGAFTVDTFGHVVNPTGSLTVAGNVVDFDLGLLAGVAIPVSRLSSSFANASSILAINGISSLVSAANPIYYLPPNLAGASHKVGQRAEQHTFGRFRVKPDLTLEDVDPTDPLILVDDGTGPGGGPRLDFDLGRLYPLTFPYSMADFVDPDTAGRVISVAIGNVATFGGPATVYLPASGGTTSLERNYVLSIRGGAGVYGSFVVASDLTPQQATGAIRFDGSNNFFLDFAALAPITLKMRQLAEPFLPLGVSLGQGVTVADELTVYLPPSNTSPSTYDLATVFGTIFGRFSIAPDLTVATTGALRLEADGRTIAFDSCALNPLRVTPAPGRMWRAAISSSSGFYAGYSAVATTLFLPDGTYGMFFNDGSSISVSLAGGAVTAATPGLAVSGGSVSLGTCDSQPPVLSLPGDITAAPASAAGAVVIYAASATDAVDPAPSLTCAPASGSIFPIGGTTVSCTATDAAGNTASGSFTVTVSDQTPPTLILPGNITTPSTSAAGAVVSFSVSAVDAIDPAPVVACSAASGATFPIGLTTVNCTATDFAGNVASGSFTIGVTVPSANVTIKGARLRANGAAEFLFRVTGPSTNLSLGSDVTRTLAPGTYEISIPGAQPYGSFTVNAFGQVVGPTGALTATGNVVDFDLGQLAGVVIPVQKLRNNGAGATVLLELAQITTGISGTDPRYYFPPSLAGSSHEIALRGRFGIFGRFRVRADLTLEDVDLTDSLAIVEDGTGPGGGGRLDFDLSRLYRFVFPYASPDFIDPDAAGQIIQILMGPFGFSGTATLYLPASDGASVYELATRGYRGLFGTFRVGPDLTPQQATGAVRFDASNVFSLDFAAMLPVTLRTRQLADPPQRLGAALLDYASVSDDITIHLPPSKLPSNYAFTTNTGAAFGAFTIAPDLTVQATGALRVAADGRTIGFDTCALNALRVTPGSGRAWLLGSATGTLYTLDGYSALPTTLFLPDAAYRVVFNDSSAINVTLAGGAITAATPGLAVSGGSVSLGSCDSQPPVLTLPADFTVSAMSAAGATVNYTATATDAVDPVPSMTCAPASGSLFPIGTTSVVCSATDARGNAASGSFNVTVSDPNPPTLTLPSNITVPSASPAGAVVSFSVSAVDAVDPAPVVACSAVSGATFPIGLTTVSCTATDFAGNVASGSFTIGVTVPSASVTIKGSRLRANGAFEYFWYISGPGTNGYQANDTTLTLGTGTYQLSVSGGLPFGAFTLNPYGQVVDATGVLLATGNVVDFDLARLAPVAIPVGRLASDPAQVSFQIGLGAVATVTGTSQIHYLPASQVAASYDVYLKGFGNSFGRFRVNSDLTLSDPDPTDALILVHDGTGPAGGPRLDFDLARLFALTFPYRLNDFIEPDAAGAFSVIVVGPARVSGPVTLHLPANRPGQRWDVLTSAAYGSYGSFTIAPDLTVQQTTELVTIDAAGAVGFVGLVPVRVKAKQLSDPFLRVSVSLADLGVVYDEATLLAPPNRAGKDYHLNPIAGGTLGSFTVAPDSSLQVTGALRLGADGRTINFDVCSLNALRVTPAPGRAWLLRSATGNLYTIDGYASVPATLFLPDAAYRVVFNDGSTINVTLAGGSITAAAPGLSVSGGSVSIGTCDDQPPALGLPADFTVAASSAAGAIVNYNATATDAVDPAPSLTCAPATGSLLALGTHTISCTATDQTGNTSSGAFQVTVADLTPPMLALPGPITVEATGPSGAAALYQVSVSDAIDPAPGVACSPASGSLFPLGATTVQCVATDNALNAASGSFSVAVLDRTPPLVQTPPDITVETGDPAGTAVPFAITATDTVDPSPQVTCTPASGSVFPVGTTAVSCSVQDASGNAAAGSLNVNVVLCPIPTLNLDPGNALPAYTNQAARTVPASITGGSCIATVELIVTGAAGPSSTPIAYSTDGDVSGEVTLAPGQNDIVLKVTDRVGRTFATGARTLVLDQAAPQLQVLSPTENSATGSSTVSLSFSVSDSSPTSVRVAGQTFNFTAASNVQSATVTLGAAGPQAIDLVASDAAGNESTARLNVLLDLAAPLASIDVADGARLGPLFGDALPFTLVVDALSAATVTTSFGTSHLLPRGGGIVQGVAPLLEGVSTLTFSVENEVGRVTTLGRAVTYDKTPPEGDVTSPQAGDFARGTLHLSADVTDALTGVAGVDFLLDGQTALTGVAGTGDAWIASFNTTTVADGPHALVATLRDGVSNTREISRSFVVDNTAPVISLSSPLGGAWVRDVITIEAAASDATSGISGISISVNGVGVGSCAASPCSLSFDTRTLGADGAFTVSATARDGALNGSTPAQITVTADNSAPANFLLRPTNGEVLTTSMVVSVNVVDAAFARVECFVDGVSLGISTNPQFSQTLSLLDRIDGPLPVSCRAEDLAGNTTVQTAVPTVRNWSLRMRPNQLNLKSKGRDVRMAVRNRDRSVANAGLLLSRLSTLFLVLPGGIAPIPVSSALPSGERDQDDDGDSDDDGDDEERGRVLLKFSRSAFVAGIKSGIAIGAIDPKKPVLVTLVSGTHVIGTDTIRVKP